MSTRLEAEANESVGEDDGDDYATLDKLTRRINGLPAMARPKGRDDEAKMKYITKSVSGTKWSLHARRRISLEPSFQRLTNALYKSMRGPDPFE